MFKRLYQKTKSAVLNSFWYKGLIEGMKRLTLPGFEGLSTYHVAKFFFQGLQKGYLSVRAAAMTYRFIMALFPALIFLFTLIPYIPIQGFQQHLLAAIAQIMPHTISKIATPTITDLITNKRGGLLSFGFILTIYYCTSGIAAMISAFGLSYNIKQPNNYFVRLWHAIILLFVLAFLMIIATGLIVCSGIILDFLKDHHIVTGWLNILLLNLGKWIVVLVFYIVSVSIIYHLGGGRKTKWKFISAGSTVASVASIIMSLGFATYVDHFGKYNKLYGSLGVLIVLLMWMYLNALVLLIGYELNASIYSAKEYNETIDEVEAEKNRSHNPLLR